VSGKREYVRDALATILRENAEVGGLRMTTIEIADAMNRTGIEVPTDYEPPEHGLRWAGHAVYPHLRMLEKRGVCRRVHDRALLGVMWEWCGPIEDDGLEAAFALPDAEVDR
jgi:hypothetical protein